MPAADPTPIRKGAMAIMAANAPLVALTPRIYPQKQPPNAAYPFVRMGAPSVVPIRASCVNGGDWTFAVHGFATPRIQGASVLETAEDYAGRLGGLIAAALDRHVITLPTGRARILWTGAQLLMDPDEADCFHTVQQFRVRAITS